MTLRDSKPRSVPTDGSWDYRVDPPGRYPSLYVSEVVCVVHFCDKHVRVIWTRLSSIS